MTLRKYLSTLKIVYIALMVSLVSIGLISFFVFHLNSPDVVFQSRISRYAILAIAAAALAIWSFTGKLLKKDPSVPLRQRVQSWYIFRVVRGAVLESVGMTGIVASVITSDQAYLLAPAFVVGVLAVSLPSPLKISHELGLSAEESKELLEMND